MLGPVNLSAINTQICWDRPGEVRQPGQGGQAESQGQIGSIQHSLTEEGSHQSGSNRAKYSERDGAKYPELLQTSEINNPWNFENLS